MCSARQRGARGVTSCLLALFCSGCSNDFRLGSVPAASDGNLLHFPDASIDPACASDPLAVRALPLDVYLMVDKSTDSSTVGGYRWDDVASAISGFAASPSAEGVSLGIQYFPELESDRIACDPKDYETPAVEIAKLPDAIVAINRSLFGEALGEYVPTRPALEGALGHAAAWAGGHPARTVIVVLVTSAAPTSDICSPNDVKDSVDVAAAALRASPSNPTFVVLMGNGFAGADGIAAAGGTVQALHVSTGHDVIPNFVAAMNAIRAAVACAYPLPPPPDAGLDYDKINLQIAAGDGGAPNVVNGVASRADCDALTGGWYYDNPVKPLRLIACRATCEALAANVGATVQVLFGCERVSSPPAH
jgi:hypothetical protein